MAEEQQGRARDSVEIAVKFQHIERLRTWCLAAKIFKNLIFQISIQHQLQQKLAE